jgi:hypothetical protein
LPDGRFVTDGDSSAVVATRDIRLGWRSPGWFGHRRTPDQDDLRKDAAGWPKMTEEYLLGRWHVAGDPAPRGPGWRATGPALGSAARDIAI